MSAQWIGTPYLKTQLLMMMKEDTDDNKDYNDAMWDVFNLITKYEREKTKENLKEED
jgi:hypothetical protein